MSGKEQGSAFELELLSMWQAGDMPAALAAWREAFIKGKPCLCCLRYPLPSMRHSVFQQGIVSEVSSVAWKCRFCCCC